MGKMKYMQLKFREFTLFVYSYYHLSKRSTKTYSWFFSKYSVEVKCLSIQINLSDIIFSAEITMFSLKIKKRNSVPSDGATITDSFDK